MHPWITGRIIETMQHDARARGERERLGHAAAQSRPIAPARREARRERVGLAVARVGLRLAGRDTSPLTASHLTATSRAPALAGRKQ